MTSLFIRKEGDPNEVILDIALLSKDKIEYFTHYTRNINESVYSVKTDPLYPEEADYFETRKKVSVLRYKYGVMSNVGEMGFAFSPS